MNTTTYAFNSLLKGIHEDINMINDPYNRAQIKVNIMQALAMTGAIEGKFIGVEGEVTSTSETKKGRKKSDRQELENHPNEEKTEQAEDISSAPVLPAVEVTPSPTGDVQVESFGTTEPAPAPAPAAQPAEPVEKTDTSKENETAIVRPEDLDDTWTDRMKNLFMPEIIEIMNIAKANIAAKKINQAFMIQCAIKSTNGLITNWRNPFDVPPRYIKIFLAEFKTQIVAINGIIPAVNSAA